MGSVRTEMECHAVHSLKLAWRDDPRGIPQRRAIGPASMSLHGRMRLSFSVTLDGPLTVLRGKKHSP